MLQPMYTYSHDILRAQRTHAFALSVVALLVIGALPCRAATENASHKDVHQAVRDNDIGFLQDLLVNANPDFVNSTIGRGVTPLHLAAALNHEDAARLLLGHGAVCDARTSDGFTPLHWAAGRDALAVATLLIAADADVNAQSSKRITPLHWAANRNATNVIALLLEAGADPVAENDTGAQPIHWAHLSEYAEAAMLIADRIVSEQIDSERSNVVVEAEAAVPPVEPDAPSLLPELAALTETDIYIAKQGTNDNRALIVNIGLGQTMVLEWVKPIGLWAGKYEVTNGQFRRYRPTHNSRFRESFTLNGNDQPAVLVSWRDAQDFCDWLNKTYRDRLPEGFIFRLPYSVEWTYLARCGENRKYPWGNQWPPVYGNFADLTARENLTEWQGIPQYDDGAAVTCPVTESGMNAWGIYGLAGNVWEWCEDDYSADSRYKVRRGASWDFDGEPNMRISAIGFDRPTVKDDTIGFRIVASQGR